VSAKVTTVVVAAFAHRQAVFCEYCGRQVFVHLPEADPARATGDHRIPRSRGGTNHRQNIAIACRACNTAKGRRTEAEFRAAGRGRRAEAAFLAGLAFCPEAAPRLLEELS
jgi:5-methylcytosine-specific restriction endonuclease McrA